MQKLQKLQKAILLGLVLFSALSCAKGNSEQQESATASATPVRSSQNEPIGGTSKPSTCTKYLSMIAQCPHPQGQGLREVGKYELGDWNCGVDAFFAGIWGKSNADGCQSFRCEEACR